MSKTGKQARVANIDDESRAKHGPSPPKQQPAKGMATRTSEPIFSTSATTTDAAQAVDAKAKHKRIPDENIAKLVAEENESKNKFPIYPGLERWELIEKMGDGAFSNVYRARDRDGTVGEVAIKVVRKYEMSSMQVCGILGGAVPSSLSPLSLFVTAFVFRFIQVPLPTLGLALEQQTSPSRL